jgi:uncharacterized pyridoxamine 5'-phosphate oxidase family protein
MSNASNDVKAVTAFLVQHKILYLATIGLDDKPKVRPFQFMREDGGRLCFCTSNQRPVFQEMQKHPYVEFCVSGENYAWMRLSGRAVFTKDLGLKAGVLDSCPLVKSIYKTPDNPVFEVFHLDEAAATLTDSSGNPPKTFRL